MKLHHKLSILFALAATLGLGTAHASGGDSYEDAYVARFAPDIDLTRFDTGDIGVLQSTYARAFLYSAWRSIVNGVKWEPTAVEMTLSKLEKSCCEKPWDYTQFTENQDKYGPGLWLKVRGEVAHDVVRVEPQTSREAFQKDQFFNFNNCPDTAWQVAAENLQLLVKRPDATAERVREWIRAQDAVFEFCGSKPKQKVKDSYIEIKPAIPASLPKNELVYWQQWRQYQTAAAYFYSGQYDKSGKLFAEIGATAGHPMQVYGKYLRLRSRLRALILIEDPSLNSKSPPSPEDVQKWGKAQWLQIKAMGTEILSDPALSRVHEATSATLRSAAFNLTPTDRFEELATFLDDPKADPYLDDHIVDWRLLADKLGMDYMDPSNPTDGKIRKNHPYIDWIQSIKSCAIFSSSYSPSIERTDKGDIEQRCISSSQYAEKQWRDSKSKNPSLAKAWLVAALMGSVNPSKDVLVAAQAVAETAPEYLTVQYHLIRIHRARGETEALRVAAKRLLAGAIQSPSAKNLLRSELFAAATNLNEAAAYMGRELAEKVNKDTGEKRSASPSAPNDLDRDGLNWIGNRVGLTDMLELANTESIDIKLRSSLAGAVWWRAFLVDKQDLSNTAAELTAKLVSGLSARAKKFTATTNANERRHILVVASLLHGLGPNPSTHGLSDAEEKPEDATASAWCTIMREEKNQGIDARLQEPFGPKPFASSADEVAKSAAILTKLPTATTYVGHDVLDWVKSNPTDKELPWLLYVTVQSTRGGCTDPGNGALSKEAFQVLHKKFPRSAWTANTPVYFP